MLTLSQLRSSRNVRFWSLHAAGWLAYGLAVYFGFLFYKRPAGVGPAIATAAAGGFVLSIPMRYVYRAIRAAASAGSFPWCSRRPTSRRSRCALS